jgi:cell division protein FtsI/penicillin-binding protein 2
MIDHQIPLKAGRVLNLILVGLLLILIRVWYLGTVQREHHLELARKPQRRVVIEHVDRATIRDRFNVPLAVNKIQYNAAVCFAEMRQIPSVVWKKDEKGKSVRFRARSAYITQLSKLLADELEMDPVFIEDAIVGKASLFPHTPFVIKEEISEKQYFRLRMLERDWAGIQAQRTSKRFYPLGKVGCDVLGYLGPISQKEYVAIAHEIEILQNYLMEREAGEPTPLPQGFGSPLEVRRRLKELQEKAYTINDLVGKSGIEASFDQNLRGSCGKKTIEVDVKGNFIRELPGARKSKSGDRILLTISAEMQELAEKLLMQHEPLRDIKNANKEIKLDYPWIKGGAIVALDAKTGEVIALASYPRFDPNDFVPSQDPEIKQKKEARLIRWLESEKYAGEIWDGKRSLEREIFSAAAGYQEETLPLTWERYLELVLPKEGSLKRAVDKIGNIKTALRLQQEVFALLQLSKQDDVALLINALYEGENHTPSRGSMMEETLEAIRVRCQEKAEEFSSHKKWLDSYLSSIAFNDDKILVIDLCRLLVKHEDFSPELLEQVGAQSLSYNRALCQAAISLQSLLRPYIQKLFHDLDFTEWRGAHFKDFLKAKRAEEKEKKRYTRPYTEYLDQLEKGKFKEFWQKHRCLFTFAFITHKVPSNLPAELQPYVAEILELSKQQIPLHTAFDKLKTVLTSLDYGNSIQFLQTLHSYQELNRPLFTRYRALRTHGNQQLEKDLASAFYPLYGYSYGRSFAFRQLSPQGSVFKLVTAYEALKQRHEKSPSKAAREMNPLTLIDDVKWDGNKNTRRQVLGYTVDGQPITRQFKGGELPRSSHSHIGRIGILDALEQSSNLYFAMLAGEHLDDPMGLAKSAHLFGFGQKTGIELPGEVAGNVPDDLAYNKTGLYSFAIGQHSFTVTPLQTALMVSTIANGGKVMQPKVVKAVAGKGASLESTSDWESSYFPFKEELSLVGVTFPLFIETVKEKLKSFVALKEAEVKETMYFPDSIRNLLLEGMDRVVTGARGTARANVIRGLLDNPKWMRDYLDLAHQVVGKTGTPEILYKQTIDAESEARIIDHTWFAGVSFSQNSKEKWKDPELVVAVLLRYGEKGGKEAAPLAIQMIKKWRELNAKEKQK